MVYLKLQNQQGTVAPGKLASLVVLNKNPLENIDALDNIKAVLNKGRMIDREAVLLDIKEQIGN